MSPTAHGVGDREGVLAIILMRFAQPPTLTLPRKGRAIAFGNGVPFLLSPRGEEGTHRISDGKVRGSIGSDVCFRKQRESCASPSPSRAAARAPPSPRWG